MQDYEYSDCLVEGRIRVLVLFPCIATQDPLRGTLETVTLADGPHYRALSYSWGLDPDGDASPCCELELDGKRLKITQNLADGLRRLRADGQSNDTAVIRLWVDAVSSWLGC